MEIKDRLLNDEELLKAKHKSWLIVAQNAAKLQRDISIKAGRKEVVDWLKDNSHRCEEGLTLHVCLDEELWRSKLKEWGIE